MIKLTITALGTPKQYTGSRGPYQRNWLRAKEYGDKFINFITGKTTQNWKVGDVIEVEAVEENQYTSKKDGSLQTSYDIKLPKFGGNGDVMKGMEEIKNMITKNHLLYMQGMKEIYEAVTVGKPKSDYPEMEEAPNFEPKGEVNITGFDHTADEDNIDQLDAMFAGN